MLATVYCAVVDLLSQQWLNVRQVLIGLCQAKGLGLVQGRLSCGVAFPLDVPGLLPDKVHLGPVAGEVAAASCVNRGVLVEVSLLGRCFLHDFQQLLFEGVLFCVNHSG